MDAMATPERHLAKDGETETWKVRFRLHGRATSRTFATSKGGQTFARLLRDVGPQRAVEILDARTGAVEGTPTVEAWCKRHIDLLTAPQPDTLAKYRAYVRNDLGNLRHLPVDAVTHEDVEAWVGALSKAGASYKTMKNKHGFLSAVFARAERKGLVAANPCKGTDLPRTERQPMVALSVPEYLRFLDCFTPYWQPLVTTLFETGLRWGEATALRVGDLELEAVDMYGDPAPTLRVERAWKVGGTIGPPKSDASRRTIALSAELGVMLAGLVEGRGGAEYVFRNQAGGPVRHQTFHDNVWLPAVRLANGEPAQKDGAKRVARRRDGSGRIIAPLDPPLGKRPRIHDARHSCASWLLGESVPPTDVQDHLGHESFTTTDQLYRHMMPSAPRRVRAALALATAPAHPQIES